MTTENMIKQLCEQMNISVAELARRIGQTPQNSNKKLKRETVPLDELKAYIKLWEDKKPLLLWDDDNEENFTKDTFIAALKNLHIGEWRKRYSTKCFGYMILDGTQWELKFECSNGHRPIRFDGNNSCPYNFDKLQMLFGIDVTEDDEEK